ncbi:MAG: hypothetical protein EOM65_04940 [Synergistales bacterium]|nr:hypothetical protein [Synergistales bacterium]
MFGFRKGCKGPGRDYRLMYERLRKSAERVWWTYDHCAGHDDLMGTQLGRDISSLRDCLDSSEG